MQSHHKRLLGTVQAFIEQAHAALEPGRMRVGIMCGPGHGDNARGLALANAVRERYRDAHIFLLITKFTGTMVEHDLCHYAKTIGAINDWMALQGLSRRLLISTLRARFAVLYDAVPYVVGTYWNLGTPAANIVGPAYLDEQAKADQALAPYRILYDGHPHDTWRLKLEMMSQWELMSESSGYEVTPEDLMAPAECAPIPAGASEALVAHAGSDSWERGALHGVGKYVVVHNSAGQYAQMKVAPPEVFAAVVARLKADGVRAVQVGGAGETRIPGSIDRLGYRLPITCKLLQDAVVFVGIEGFLPYMAHAVGTRSIVLYGPTMPWTFGIEGDMPLLRMRDGEDSEKVSRHRAFCPAGTCFQGGGWSPSEGWGTACRVQGRAAAGEPQPSCLNFLPPADAAAQVSEIVQLRIEMMREGVMPAPATEEATA